MAGTILKLLDTPGEYRLALQDNRRQETVAVSHVTRRLEVGDRWVVADDVDHDMIAITSGTIDLDTPGQFSWTLVLADAVKFG